MLAALRDGMFTNTAHAPPVTHYTADPPLPTPVTDPRACSSPTHSDTHAPTHLQRGKLKNRILNGGELVGGHILERGFGGEGMDGVMPIPRLTKGSIARHTSQHMPVPAAQAPERD